MYGEQLEEYAFLSQGLKGYRGVVAGDFFFSQTKLRNLKLKHILDFSDKFLHKSLQLIFS